MKLSIAREHLFHDWRDAFERSLAYARALGADEPQGRALAESAVLHAARGHWPADASAAGQTLAALRESLCPDGGADPERFRAWLVHCFRRGGLGAKEPTPSVKEELPASPGLRRAPLRPAPLAGPRWLRSRRRAAPRWARVALRRRILLTLLVVLPALAASASMASVLPGAGVTPLSAGLVLVFGLLFGWISIGFWTALLGAFTLVRDDRFRITRELPTDAPPARPGTRTALLMPVCDEPVERVFTGLAAIHASLEATGQRDAFDFYVLSDSRSPDAWVAEETAWARFCRDVDGFGHVFYRRRRSPVKRKSGNVADFLRRFGRRYRYAVVLDADSVMSGPTLVALVRAMERNPAVGLIQTVPRALPRRSLFGRIQAFTVGLYGPIFAAGLHFWQLGNGQYWGHNAILRVEPFMRHCILPKLSGRPPFGGEILSHDFVEAALLGRAGYELWLAYELEGSYEEVPGSLLEEMRRDRRWCQGNLQHLRLLFTSGIVPAHRALFLNGVLSYVTALLWGLFLVLGTAKAMADALATPDYFPDGPALFPEWPVWNVDFAMMLIGATGVVLFLPKVLAVALVVGRGESHRWGGTLRLVAGVGVEAVFSALVAPVRMAFHSRFVLASMLGAASGWRAPLRNDHGTSWSDAFRHHGPDTVLGCAWGALVLHFQPGYLPWLSPVLVALVLSIPLSVLTSRPPAGEGARILTIPEEADHPPELRALDHARRTMAPLPSRGLEAVIVDPFVYALHTTLLRGRRRLAPGVRFGREALAERLVSNGLDSLTPAEQHRLLQDAVLLARLHEAWWSGDP